MAGVAAERESSFVALRLACPYSDLTTTVFIILSTEQGIQRTSWIRMFRTKAQLPKSSIQQGGGDTWIIVTLINPIIHSYRGLNAAKSSNISQG